ncbi:transmembrane gamma-carboxyglutamic acid protein 1 [Pristis pectinata]|uniref:transmembrane gamma-carboxyglutamic acid protein 1 n=1 Tax=Pristis pectinata TaxID=685728 RepID=UPI00223DA81D|nr:transmembrane gamma-carboxyglutamic acid protein 1 [Pristis pectinata]XP_051870149.1 transmembrane gamma-carboxyglutamic acid protein 1 [Pristis pectinata]XP_051870150.1 transmembrane gamma-carboxyglutamic acid protein 1 [Pristis pectinata]XP_051870151.1 transmembrane gamma-carboxyglutamic acid protein 1 [Pristis pectinata]XP_051870152.1 transmembrane gamma-carboxyglutamic acid protein 1 [Pristis pectinata]
MESVFLKQGEANSILKRYRRKNSFLEEVQQGNIERECREEVCTYEEAREAFENDEKTNDFWTAYIKEQNENQGSSANINMESVYLVAPLMAGLLVIIIILFVIWRCQVRKANRRRNAYAQTQRQANQPTRNLSVVVFGFNEHPVSPLDRLRTLQPESMSSENSNQNGLPARLSGFSNSDPPPSYDEATRQVENIRINNEVRQSEDPPKYEEIVNPM